MTLDWMFRLHSASEHPTYAITKPAFMYTFTQLAPTLIRPQPVQPREYLNASVKAAILDA